MTAELKDIVCPEDAMCCLPQGYRERALYSYKQSLLRKDTCASHAKKEIQARRNLDLGVIISVAVDEGFVWQLTEEGNVFWHDVENALLAAPGCAFPPLPDTATPPVEAGWFKGKVFKRWIAERDAMAATRYVPGWSKPRRRLARKISL